MSGASLQDFILPNASNTLQIQQNNNTQNAQHTISKVTSLKMPVGELYLEY